MTPPPPSAAPPRAEPRRAPVWRLVLVFLLALGAVSFALSRAAPLPPGGGLAAKLAAYAEQAADTDLVILGTSRVARGVIPEVLDAELAARGHPLRSYNLSVLGMGALELDHVLDRVLELGAGRLRAVLIEVDSWRPARADAAPGLRARDVYWHDLRRTSTALESLWDLRQVPGGRAALVSLASQELERFAIHQLSLGRLAWWIGQTLAPHTPEGLEAPTPEQARALRGHHPYDAPQAEHFVRQQENAARRGVPSRYDTLLAATRAPGERDRDASHYHRPALRRQIARVRAAGVVPLYLLPPSVKTRAWIRTLAEEGELPALLDFHDPARYPGLFELARRYDVDHLNQEGAELFSRVLAVELARALDAAESPEPPEPTR